MKAKYIVIFFLSLLSFVACDKEEVVIPTPPPRPAYGSYLFRRG